MPARGGGVLLVDAAAADRRRLKHALEACGWQVWGAAGPAPDRRFPGNSLILGGEIDSFAHDLVRACGLRFVPT